MKKFLILILICFAQNAFSQTQIEDNSIHSLAGIEVKPKFPGGSEAFNLFIKENFKNPGENEEGEVIKGTVYAIFVVEKDGALNDIKIIRDIGYRTSQEVIRVLKLSPKWIPGKQNGELVRVLYSIPISINQ